MSEAAVRQDNQDFLLVIKVQPRASKDEIVGLQGDSLKIRITAPPVDGKANEHLCKYLAKQFGVAKSQVHLLSGETGRDKRIRVERPTKLPEVIRQLLL